MFLANKLRMGPSDTLMYVSSATGVSSISVMPMHQLGDLLVVYATATGSTIPSLPSGWSSLGGIASGASGTAYRIAYKVASSDTETSGTWTNSQAMILLVYRNQARTSPMSAAYSAISGTTSSISTVTYGGLTPAANTSFVLAFISTRTPNISALSTPPSGMVNRAFVANANISIAVHDTNKGVASWPSTSVNIGVTISGDIVTRFGLNQKT